MKLISLETANFKRIKAVRINFTENGLTVIGGRNGQGKTSVLDAIAFALGGGKRKPSNMRREGSVGDTFIRIETDSGLVIERKGKDASLTVTDSEGKRSGQALLDTLVSDLAIDLPKFHNARSSEKARMLMGAITIPEGVAEKYGFPSGTPLDEMLDRLEKDEKSKYETRTVVGRQEDQKRKAAADMPWHEDAPKEPVSVSDLIRQQQEVLARNGAKQSAKDQLDQNRRLLEDFIEQKNRLALQLESVDTSIKNIKSLIADAENKDFELESTAELEAQIADFEETNRKVNENVERLRREADADALAEQYASLTHEIEDIRARRLKLLEEADFPIEGLSVEDGELKYDGKSWDCMSGSQQLIVDCAIASRMNPECRFVLLDKMEQLDIDTLKEFGEWLEGHGLQCIATRVSTNADGECSIVIEDGTVEEDVVVKTPVKRKAPVPKKPALPDEY